MRIHFIEINQDLHSNIVSFKICVFQVLGIGFRSTVLSLYAPFNKFCLTLNGSSQLGVNFPSFDAQWGPSAGQRISVPLEKLLVFIFLFLQVKIEILLD